MSEPATLLWFWDYDTQWGADRSRNHTRVPDWGPLEFENTERVLESHAEFGVPACFAVVGAAALPGSRPYHDPAQVRRIHAAGHEVASHSFRHEWLPGLTGVRLHETLRRSKDALEQCVGAEVVTFVPPYNQPFDYPAGFSFSLAERREAWGNRTDLAGLCAALRERGYRVCRVGYREMHLRLLDRVGAAAKAPPKLEEIAGVTCVRNTPGGYDAPARRVLERRIGQGGVWVLYGHPHSVTQPNSPQHIDQLRATLALVRDWERAGRVRCVLPRALPAAPSGASARALAHPLDRARA